MKHSKEKLNTLTKFSILVALVVVPVFSYVIFDVSAGQIINKVLKRESLDQGLVGHWTFDGKDMLSNVADVSGQGNDGTLNGQTSTTTAIGKIGQALEFDGVDDYVDTGTFIPPSADATYCFWLITTSSGTEEFAMFSEGPVDNGAYDRQFEVTSGTVRTRFWYSGIGSGSTLTGSTPVNDGNWHYFCAVNDSSSSAYHYVDGVQDVSGTYRAGYNSYTTPVWQLGAAVKQGTAVVGYGAVELDDTRIYNRALSADEVNRLYHLGATAKVNKTIKPANSPLEDGLIGHWTFDGKDVNQATNVITDTSGQGNDGTTYGYDTAPSI